MAPLNTFLAVSILATLALGAPFPQRIENFEVVDAGTCSQINGTCNGIKYYSREEDIPDSAGDVVTRIPPSVMRANQGDQPRAVNEDEWRSQPSEGSKNKKALPRPLRRFHERRTNDDSDNLDERDSGLTNGDHDDDEREEHHSPDTDDEDQNERDDDEERRKHYGGYHGYPHLPGPYPPNRYPYPYPYPFPGARPFNPYYGPAFPPGTAGSAPIGTGPGFSTSGTPIQGGAAPGCEGGLNLLGICI